MASHPIKTSNLLIYVHFLTQVHEMNRNVHAPSLLVI